MSFNFRVESGYMYVIKPQDILLYGKRGIALRLNQNHLKLFERTMRTYECLKDTDNKGKRFTVSFVRHTNSFKFEMLGERIDVEAEYLISTLEKAHV